MTVYDLKPRFQNLLRPLTAWLFRKGITANQVTLSAMVLSIACGLLLIGVGQAWLLPLLPLVLFVRMALNAIDGMLAREYDQKSDLGCLLNEGGDVVSDVFLYLPFIQFVPDAQIWLVWTFAGSAILTEFAGVLAVMIHASRRYDGPFGKSDRATAIGGLALLTAFGWFPAGWLGWVFAIASLLAILTTVNRLQKALNEVQNGIGNQ